MRTLYKILSAFTTLNAIINGGSKGLAKNQVNRFAHKQTSKALKKLWK